MYIDSFYMHDSLFFSLLWSNAFSFDSLNQKKSVKQDGGCVTKHKLNQVISLLLCSFF